MSGHLGPQAAALVDDQLRGADRDRALRHVAACSHCRFEVDQQRAMKARLDGLGQPVLPGSLLDRLQSMHTSPPAPPASEPRPVEVAPRQLPLAVGGGALGDAALAGGGLGGGVPGGRRPSTVLPLAGVAAGLAPHHRVRRVLVGATSLVLLGGGAAYAAGGSGHTSGTPVRPAVEVYTVQHGTTSGAVPLNDPAVSAVTVGFGR